MQTCISPNPVRSWCASTRKDNETPRECEAVHRGPPILPESALGAMIDRQEARSDVARIDPAADRWLHTANRARATTDPRVGRLVKSHCFDLWWILRNQQFELKSLELCI
jgi:hypothetical protein